MKKKYYFSKVRNFRKIEEMFHYCPKLQNHFGNLALYILGLDMFGHVWTSLDKFGQAWTSLDKLGQV